MHFTRTYPRIIFTQPGLGIATLKTVITLLSVSPIGKCCPQHHWSMICGRGAGSGRRWCLDQAAPSGDLSAFISILFPTPTTSLGFSWCSYHPAWVTDCVNHFKMPEVLLWRIRLSHVPALYPARFIPEMLTTLMTRIRKQGLTTSHCQ